MTQSQSIFFITAGITGLLFVIFVLIYYPPSFLRLQIISVARHGTAGMVALERLTGFLFFGVIPYIILLLFLPDFHLRDLGVVLPSRAWLLPSVVFWMVIIFVVSRAAGSPAGLEQYPQMRDVRWTPAMILLNAVTWGLYLAGYEFFFRGLLVFPFLPLLGITWTVVLNLVLYALAHLHKGRREVGGSFFFGILLVLATIYSGSLLISFFSHLVLALSNGYFASRAMKMKASHGN